jgi:MinD superfamily P-loop ATPase
MKKVTIAVASGKGGTGKTMVSTSMAASLASSLTVQFLDCDVEAPNGHLFLKPLITRSYPAEILIPKINEQLCTACGRCVEVCEFNALAMLQEKILVFPQLCHGCGSCFLNCPVNAITEEPRQIGIISHGTVDPGIQFSMGELTISEPMPTPIIRQLKKQMRNDLAVTLLDSPPGASCAVVATLNNADFVLLVTEPTPFGLHDLKQMLGILEKTGTPAGVIINRVGIGDLGIESYLAKTQYPVLMQIPYEEKIAVNLAKGDLLIKVFPEYQQKFIDLFDQIITILTKAEAINA